MGFVSGLIYSPVEYSYQVRDSLGKDKLSYFSIPLGIRLIPSKKTSIELGAHYNIYNKGGFIISKDDIERNEVYAEGVFRNSMGGFLQVSYQFYKRLIIFVNYRWASRNSPALQTQTNNTSGLQLGLTYPIWSSQIKY